MNISDVFQGRYEIQESLGDRATHKTFLARDRQTDTLVVIKLMYFNSGLTWDSIRLFEREAATLKSLHHPAIPRYLDYFEIKGDRASEQGFALVQSYIPAGSLSAQVKAGRRFSEAALKGIAREILKVLDYLHSHQPPIIHRDIKPSNVLLNNDPLPDVLIETADESAQSIGQIYLVDFGSVQALQSDSSTRTVVGTYGYMPPEQFGDRAVPASDLYSLGATLLYLATGQHPADLPTKRLRLCFEEQVSLSSDFVHWLQQMIEPALEERLSSAKVALAQLENPTPPATQAVVAQSPVAPLFQPSVALAKPADSRVVVNKQFDRLEITIPPKGFTLGLLPAAIFAAVWNVFMLNWYSIALRMGGAGLFMALFGIGHLGVGIWQILKILFTLKGTTVLQIDENTISLTYKLFGYSYQRHQPAPRENIARIERTMARRVRSRRNSRRFRTKTHSVSPQLNVWAGTKKFGIGNSATLSVVELDWLASELSHWLELPVE